MITIYQTLNFMKVDFREDKTVKRFGNFQTDNSSQSLIKSLADAFQQPNPPAYLDILGERAKSKVYEYHDKPTRRKYLEYNHTMKRCTKNTVCANCALKGHDIKDCQSEMLKCYHLGINHKTDDRKCAIQHEQEEIMTIRSKMHVTREQAKLIYLKQNPKYQKTYAEATQPSISNCPTANEHSKVEIKIRVWRWVGEGLRRVVLL